MKMAEAMRREDIINIVLSDPVHPCKIIKEILPGPAKA